MNCSALGRWYRYFTRSHSRRQLAINSVDLPEIAYGPGSVRQQTRLPQLPSGIAVLAAGKVRLREITQHASLCAGERRVHRLKRYMEVGDRLPVSHQRQGV